MQSLTSGALLAWRQQTEMLLVPWRKLAHLAQALALVAAALMMGAALWRLAETRTAATATATEEEMAVAVEQAADREDAGKGAEADNQQFRWDLDVSVKRDWHDWSAIQADKERTGPGEGGKAYKLTQDMEKKYYKTRNALPDVYYSCTPIAIPITYRKLQKKMYNQNGFDAYVSELISVNRSVKDIRHPDCATKEYSAQLPSVSVIIPFINEHLHTLKRTIHSVTNRSPAYLLEEIILVDDFSNQEDLRGPLEDYLASQPSLSTLVKIERLQQREGLIVARQMGALRAKGQVLIFLDSHTEANYNWLPPLLDPIAKDYRVAVCPFIDVIDMDNFQYRAQDEGKRGSWNWEMYYKRLDLLPEDLQHPTRPFKSPVMAGGLFAISAQFFWELGGYDQGLKIWGGEQYELSFKIWQCGGKMFDAPCSRVGHIYRKFAPFGHGGVGDYLGKNIKRVAEVWMDDFKEHIYNRRPQYRHLDPGDLTPQKELRERLRCKPFSWFMENVAFDQPFNYPAVEPGDYAWGRIRNGKFDGVCASEPRGGGHGGRYFAARCDLDNSTDDNTGSPQYFVMDWHKDLRTGRGRSMCWDVSESGLRASVRPFACHGGKGNQLWRYDTARSWLIHGINERCLDTDGSSLFVSDCDASSQSQKWKFDHFDEERLRGWDLKKL